MNSSIDWVAVERLIGNIVAKFVQPGVCVDDLKQEARLVVLEIHGQYHESTGVSYSTFLTRDIYNKLRTFVANSLGFVEMNREWVAESISGTPDESIRTKTKEECSALRQLLGPEKYRKPKRKALIVRVLTSLDEPLESSNEEEVYSLHETIGTPAEQDSRVSANERVGRVRRRQTLSKTQEAVGQIIQLRMEGCTFAQIGEQLGKSANSVRMAFVRAQERAGT